MSDRLTRAVPRFSRVTNRGAWIAAAAVLALALAAGVVWWPGSTLDRPSASPGAATSAFGSGHASGRAGAIRALLASRSRAILHHDRSALLATIDPTRSGFAAAQARMLTNLRRVPLASWSYTLSGRQARGAARADTGGPVSTYQPVVSLHYRIRGFDRVATDLTQYPTFIHRGGRWYLASLGGLAGRGHRSASELWDFGPVDVVRRPGVLVLGAPSMLRSMHQVAAGLRTAIPRVTSVWGDGWARRVVAEVPRSQAELGSITGDTSLARIAALTSAEIHSTPGHPDPVGDRVAVNPHTWPSLDAVGRRVVLTHELTHVASRADTGGGTPRWLQEGFADYVGFRGTRLRPAVVAAELARDVRAGHSPVTLPADRRFDGSAPRLAQAYQEGWLACRLIAARTGTPTLVRFYRQVGTSTAGPGPAVNRALHRLLHLSTRRFTALWVAYVRQQLA